MNYFTFIVAGIRNKPGRNFATIFCFAFIAANIFSGQFLLAGAAGGIDRGVSRMGADQIVVPSQYMVFLRGSGPENTVAIVRAEPSTYRFKASIMDRLGNVQGVSELSPQLFVSTQNLTDLSPVPVDIYGIDPVTDFTIQPWLQKPLDATLAPGEVIVGHRITGVVSSRISIRGHLYTIAGRLDPTQSSIDNTIFLRLDDAYTLAAADGILPPSAPRISKGDINAVLIRDTTGENPEGVVTRIKRLFASSSESRYVSVIGRHFTLDPVLQDIQAIPGIMNSISVFVVIIAFPLIALISAMVTHERQREIGLLKSMGAKRSVIFFLVISESLVLAVIGGIVGVSVSFLAVFLLNAQGVLNSALQVSFRMPGLTETGLMAGLVLLVVIVIGSLSSLIPAYRISMMNPYDAIRNDGQ
jgi:putative ABC transport system permease protein